MYLALKAKPDIKFPPPPAQKQPEPKPAAAQEKRPQAEAGKEEGKVPKKYLKLIGDMNLVKGNINFTNEIIDSTKPGDRSNETLNDLFKTLTQMEPKLFGLIAQIENENVMTACLLVNDDLQKTFKRYHAIREGKKPEKFVPGESTQKTVLEPTHIYVQQEVGKMESDQKKAAQPPPKKADPIGDLLAFGPGPTQAQQQSQPNP